MQPLACLMTSAANHCETDSDANSGVYLAEQCEGFVSKISQSGKEERDEFDQGCSAEVA